LAWPSPATSSLSIIQPFHGGSSGLFSTHPPMEKRIEKLETLALGIRPSA
jgi:heat shock protein HtpX